MAGKQAIKLTYFNLTGRAEITRLAFHIGGIPFIDERIKRDEFNERKPTLPFGQVPVLTINDKVFSQSSALARYAGAVSGLYPKEPLSALQVDEILAHSKDIFDLLPPTLKVADKDQRIAMRQEIAKTRITPMCEAMERRLAQVKAPNGNYLLGDEITLADLELYLTNALMESEWFEGVPADTCHHYPTWMSVVNAVAQHPKVQSYISKANL
ncbi:hypothetical protein THRCLA_09346 [Thraustotheca clavata]|uniref:Glutathione S-transferase n=1 Tax=Thraustotheca clavata TaxID=74557 RepID=A0A1V9YXJ4_9STRA|nr:hypothetical protein THRCLA_09346 [Thraustotheca clavata]